MNYYEEIKNELIDNELNKRAKDYSKNRSDLTHYYNVGKLIVEVGKHYGDGIIREYSRRLTIDLGKGYTETNLKYFRQFYYFVKSHALRDELSWTHYRTLLSVSNNDEIDYYINICVEYNLGYRDLAKRIKNNEYQRLDDRTKSKLINKNKVEVYDLIKNPVIIKNTLNKENISKKYLMKLILGDIPSFMR